MRLVALGVMIALTAQEPPQQTFRSGAQIVQVDVRVFKDGRFVSDLTPADFEVLENGVSQNIQSVVLIGAAAPVAPPPVAPDSTRGTAPVAPGTPVGPVAPAIWVFVFDAAHLSPGGLQRTREAVVKFIADKFHQGDIGGIVVDGKMANNRLTSDRNELRAAAEGVKMPGELRSRQMEVRDWPRFQDELEVIKIGADDDAQTLQTAVARACTEEPDQCKRGVPVDLLVKEKARRLFGDIQRATLNTLATIETLSNGLARLAGPKTIVFLSEGFIGEKLVAELQQAEAVANRAGAHFYTIDARGLNKGAASSDIIDQPVATALSGSAPRFDAQTDGTNSLAIDTGGLAIRNENNFGRALDDIQRDAATYYVVGYTPSNGTFDGKYRSISVKVARPGVSVRARRGYVALEPAALLRPGTVTTSAPAGVAPVPSKPVPEAGPKRSTEEASAKAENVDFVVPDLPVSPGLIALPGVPAPDANATAAVRARIDAGRIVLQLKEQSGFGEPRSATDSSAERGWSAYERGDIDTAARELKDASRMPNARPWVQYALGFAEFAQKRYADAAQAWELVRSGAPEFEPVYFSLADAYLQQHDDGAAIKVLREAEQRWPADAEAANAVGVIQIRRGALDAAIASFERAIGLAPAEGLGYFNLGRAHQLRAQTLQRYDPQLERWIGGEEDRRRAIAAFQKYLEIGGPFEGQAREAITALGWIRQP